MEGEGAVVVMVVGAVVMVAGEGGMEAGMIRIKADMGVETMAAVLEEIM